MERYLYLALIFAFINEALVQLGAKSVFFSPLRDLLDNSITLLGMFFSRVFSCPYCLSVWSSFAVSTLLFLFDPPKLLGNTFLDLFIFIIGVHRLSNKLHDFSDKFIDKSYNV